jgi:hypothetical protein
MKELNIVQNIDWPKLAESTAEKIRTLGAISASLKGDTGVLIAKDLVIPALSLLRAFDESVSFDDAELDPPGAPRDFNE